jgi:signal transduction histidine kinase
MVDTEEKFKEMVFDMRVGVQGPRAEILLSNPALELLACEDQLLGKTSFDPEWKVMIHEVHHFRAIRTLFLLLLLPEAVRCNYGVYRPLSKDNVWLLVDAIPQKIVNNTVEQVVCTFIDITGRKEAELALEKGNEIREINLTKDKLFSIIAHDLRSPFNIILGFSAIIKKNTKVKTLHKLNFY